MTGPAVRMLDTSAYAHFRRGRTEALEAITSASHAFLPSIVIGELWSGFLAGIRTAWNVQRLEQFLHTPASRLLR